MKSQSSLNKCLLLIKNEYKEFKNYQIIYKGINSKVVELDHDSGQKSILKIYPTFNNDNRNRLESEKKFLKYLKLKNIRNCPEIYYANESYNFLVISFIDGIKIKDYREISLIEIAEFSLRLNKSNLKTKKNSLPLASEASFNVKDIMKLIKSKTKEKELKFKNHKTDSFFKEWFNNELIVDIYENLKYIEENFSLQGINDSQKIISQSDVGFHNMILKNKELFFIDFEYAGWDNPMKYISDWILQPDSFFPNEKPLEFFDPIAKTAFNNINWKIEIKPYLLLYRLRWCLILTNQLQNKNLSKEEYNSKVSKLKHYYQKSKLYLKDVLI